MAKELSVVSEVFNQSNIRIIDHGGEPVFCLADVCKSIEMREDHARRSLGFSSEKMGTQFGSSQNELVFEVHDSLGRIQKTRFVDEDQAYQLIMVGRSDLSREFRKLVSKIVKQLRKEGVVDLRPAKTEAEKILEAITLLQGQIAAEKQAKELAEAKIQRLTHSKQTFTATEMAKDLGLRSAHKFNETLCLAGIQYKCINNNHYVLSAEYSDKGYSEVRQSEFTRSSGDLDVSYSMHFTPEGRAWLIEKWDWILSKASKSLDRKKEDLLKRSK